jgi:hypothetical protein
MCAAVLLESRDEIIKRIGRSPDLAIAYIVALVFAEKWPSRDERPLLALTHDPYASQLGGYNPNARL